MANDSLKVLIVDDEPMITLFLKEVIEDAGDYAVDICHDSDTALWAIKHNRPDLIFMDINIKGPLDGISVIRTAGAHNAVVYYMSAYNGKEIIDDALSTNPYFYLVKPIKEHDVHIALSLAKRAKNPIAPNMDRQVFLAPETYYDIDRNEVLQNGNIITLTLTEKRLIGLFSQNMNQILSPERIKETLWEDKELADSTLRNFISALRQKLPHVQIQNRFGQGYMLTV